MLLINIYLRLAIIAVCLIGGGVLAGFFGFWYAFPFFLISLFFIVGYFLLGTVQSAAMIMQKEDFDGAEKRLKLTLFPKLLYPANRAYLYILKGSIAMARKEMDEGEMWMKKAQSIKLPSDNERAMVEMQLASIALSRNKFQQAQNYLRSLKQYNITEPNLKEQIKYLEKAMANQGQMKAVMRQGGFRGGQVMMPGGKRKRPKIR